MEGIALGCCCELALACAVMVASREARFGPPKIKLGMMPGAGGTQRLLRSAGRYVAPLWCLQARPFPAAEAQAAHLVSELFDAGHALERAVAIGEQSAAMPPLAVQANCGALRPGAEVLLETALAVERRLFDSEDHREGKHAFLERRGPAYHGR